MDEPFRNPAAPRKRHRRVRFLLILFLILVIPLGALYLNATLKAASARQGAIDRLAAAADEAALEQAVGALGVVLKLQNGEWIAIAYHDSHQASSFFSCSVALCSDGTWMESSEHYCGEFGAYRHYRQSASEPDMSADFQQMTQDSLREQRLYSVETAPDLAGARLRLQEIGFQPFVP